MATTIENHQHYRMPCHHRVLWTCPKAQIPRHCLGVLIAWSAAFSLVGCATVNSTSESMSSAFDCPSEGFHAYPYEHITNPNDGEFVAATLDLQITNLSDEWPEEQTFEVQIFQAGGEHDVQHFKVDYTGFFRPQGLQAGKYCMKISTEGWQTEVYLVNIDPDSDNSKPLRVTLYLSV